MNKKLIALAVAGACVAPAAMAQTANPVTLYGRVHVNVESAEATGLVPLPRRTRVQDEASRFGIKGTEDLGGGLSAFFQLETAFYVDQNVNTGAATGNTVSPFATRNSAVGLQGGWGSLLIGRWDTPFKVAANSIDPFGDVTWGGQAVAALGSGAGGVSGQFDIRQQNVIQYWTPNWAGFSARLSMAANEGKTAAANPRSNGATVGYNRGPIMVSYAYHELKDYAAYSNSAAGASGAKQALNGLLGSFTFGPIKVQGLYHKIKRTGYGATSYSDQKSFVANIVWTMGNNQIIWQHGDNKNGGVTTLATQPSCKADAVAWQYNFSKRTATYIQYAKIDNNDTGTCNSGTYPGTLNSAGALGAGVVNLPAGQDVKALSWGLAMNF
jgi:predicted porin